MLLPLLVASTMAPTTVFDQMQTDGLTNLGAYRFLSELTTQVGGRLSGSPEAAKAVVWGEAKMQELGLEKIHLVPCMVPHWVRGAKESGEIVGQGSIALCALGGSVATPTGGITAEVVEVHSLKEAEELGERGKGKVVFYNRPFEAALSNAFEMYGKANDQRFAGASAAAKCGAVGVLVRSMTAASDDLPHTGGMRYGGDVKLPAVALGIQSANRISAAIKQNPHTQVHFETYCANLPEVESASVVGEITGTEHPEQVIVIGGHLDSWDLAQGAHDDGAGVTQSLEALRLLKALGQRPKRTIRVVLFMNEENGTRGAKSYAEAVKSSGERAYVGIESDSGGFMPRSFGVSPKELKRAKRWEARLRPFGIERFEPGGGDADIEPLEPLGAVLFGLVPENQRYFDYHHAANDTLDKVNPRELEFGALAMAALAWSISQEGL